MIGKDWLVLLFDFMVLELEGLLIFVVCRNVLLFCLLGVYLFFVYEIKREIRLMIEEISLKFFFSESVGDKK